MSSNANLERIIEDSIKSTEVDTRFIDILKSSDIIVQTLLDPEYQEFIRSEDTTKFTEEEQINYSTFIDLLDVFRESHRSYYLFKDQKFPELGSDKGPEDGLIPEEEFNEFNNYMLFRLENLDQVDFSRLLRLAYTFQEGHFPIRSEKAEFSPRGASDVIPDNKDVHPAIERIGNEDVFKTLEGIILSNPRLKTMLNSLSFLDTIFGGFAHIQGEILQPSKILITPLSEYDQRSKNKLLIKSLNAAVRGFERAKSTFFLHDRKIIDDKPKVHINFNGEAYEKFKEDYGAMVSLSLGDLQILNPEFLKEYAEHLRHKFRFPNHKSPMSDKSKIVYKTILRQKEKLENLRERVFEVLFRYDEYAFHSRESMGEMIWDLTSLSDEWYSGIQGAQTFVSAGSRPVREKPLEEMVDEYMANTKNDIVNIVDIGCGDGRKSIHIMEYMRKKYPDTEARLHLVDTSEDMLDIARMNAYDAQINPTTRIGDIKRAPINPILDEFFNSLLAGVEYTQNVEEVVPRDQIFINGGLLDTYQTDLSIGNLVLCLGNTIGNMSSPKLVIKNLMDSTRNPRRDMILFDHDIIKNAARYEDKSFMVGFMENAGFDMDLFRYHISEDEKGIRAEFIYTGEQPLILSQQSENRILETGFNFINYLNEISNDPSEEPQRGKRIINIRPGERILVATSGKFKPTEFEEKVFTAAKDDYRTFMRRYSTHHKMIRDEDTMYVLSATAGKIPDEVQEAIEILDDDFYNLN